MTNDHPHRREFLQTAAAGVTAAALTQAVAAQPAADKPAETTAGVPQRPFGKTKELVSIMALGGHASTNPKKLEEAQSLRLIQRAVDEGITFMDNCWDYHDGVAEERMGKALAAGGRRDKTFLMTKVCGRTAREAQANLEDSLRRLQTDRIDLWQFHEIVYDNDPDWIFADDGAIHIGLQALKEGKVRYLGFTGHKDPAIHLKMLDKPHPWDAVLMPLNVMDAHFRSFQKLVLPELVRRGIAPLGMKSLGGNGSIVTKAGVPVEDALRYVLSLPIASLVSGIDSENVLDQNLAIVRGFESLGRDQMAAIEQRSQPLAGDGRFELFKTTKDFDGPVHRRQHGFAVDKAS
ncbi:MAG: aldo/keto reductase [Pirellulales bacterium]